jgi:ADP-heptose:LPS heptosyltransferase
MPQSFERKQGSELKVMASGGLGDCLLLTPFFKHFRASGLYEKIICATSTKAVELFDMNPNIDLVIPCFGKDLYLWGLPEKDCTVFSPYMKVTGTSKPGQKMTITADPLFGFNRVDKTVVHQLAQYYSIDLEDESLEIYTGKDDEQYADEVTRIFGDKPLVLINTTSTYKQKEYPMYRWQEVVDCLSDHVIIVELATENSQLRGTQIITPMPNLRASAAILKRMACVITIDSFAHHLACAVGTPAVVLFGPSNPKAFGHEVNTNIRTSECEPCADTIRRLKCKHSHCMEAIPPETIIDAVLYRCQSNPLDNS